MRRILRNSKLTEEHVKVVDEAPVEKSVFGDHHQGNRIGRFMVRRRN